MKSKLLIIFSICISTLYAEENTYIKQQEQMAELFQRDKSVITRHIGNIYSEGELLRESTSAKIAFVPETRDRAYEVTYYNLDIS